MKLAAAPLEGAWVVESERLEDARGFFARTFCAETFRRHGLNPAVDQCSVSYNRERGTLRGMHFQALPHAEAKLVRCTHGAVFDVIVDVRAASATRGRWFGLELSARNRRMLYVPEGFAHGFLTLEPDSELHYQISVPYQAASQRGFRWDDPGVGIQWPAQPRVVSDRDCTLPAFSALA